MTCGEISYGERQRSKALLREMKCLWEEVARATGLEPATSGVTGRHSNRLSYARAFS